MLKVLDTIRELAERNAILSKQNVSNNLTLEILKVFQIREILRDKELGEKKSTRHHQTYFKPVENIERSRCNRKIDGKAAYE